MPSTLERSGQRLANAFARLLVTQYPTRHETGYLYNSYIIAFISLYPQGITFILL